MIVYLVHIKKFAVSKRQESRLFYPIQKPKPGQEVLLKVTEDFPAAFEYWQLKSEDFINKSKVFGFKNIQRMFAFFSENEIDVGTTVQSFYKRRAVVPDQIPPEGYLIYQYKHIAIYALRIV